MDLHTTDTTRSWDETIGTVRVLFGEGRLAELGGITASLGVHRPLVVSDAGLRAAGHLTVAEESLAAAGLEAVSWEGASENPTAAEVALGAEAATAHRADSLVAVGGGSAMDCAKGINFVFTNGGTMADYRGYGRATRSLLPSVGVPTTAGTGSEAQSYAIISDTETHEKMACGDPGASFHTVILDPSLPRSAPPTVAATSGLEAVSHAVESFVTTRRSPLSTQYARTAWRLLDGALESALARPTNEEAWAKMLLGAHLAGAAIELSMLGAAHAAANPLTARHGVTHGTAVLLMLPWVVRFNGETCEPLYRELADSDPGPGAAAALANRLEVLRAAGALPATLRQVDVSRAELHELAKAATSQWTARFNPRPVGEDEFRRLYEAAY
jgi:alcohol dehydrogenase